VSALVSERAVRKTDAAAKHAASVVICDHEQPARARAAIPWRGPITWVGGANVPRNGKVRVASTASATDNCPTLQTQIRARNRKADTEARIRYRTSVSAGAGWCTHGDATRGHANAQEGNPPANIAIWEQW